MTKEEAQSWPRLCLDIQVERDEAVAQRDNLKGLLMEAWSLLDINGRDADLCRRIREALTIKVNL